jgi:hypothetical protein
MSTRVLRSYMQNSSKIRVYMIPKNIFQDEAQNQVTLCQDKHKTKQELGKFKQNSSDTRTNIAKIFSQKFFEDTIKLRSYTEIPKRT